MAAYFTHASVVRTRKFTCRACGHSAKAEITGIGEGTASSLNVTGGGPEATAKRRAEQEAELDVDRCLAAVACPKCGHRDERAMKKALGRVVIPLVLTCGFIALVGWIPALFDMELKDKAIAGWVMTAIAVVVGGFWLLFSWPRTAHIDARVKFETETYRDGGPT